MVKILISSLQVSHEGSKGHFQPAFKLALSLKNRGYKVSLLPLPSPFSKTECLQIQSHNIDIINPPALPNGLLLSSNQLGKLAKHISTVHLAYESFLVAPLIFQFEGVYQKIENFSPDIVVYDLLAYTAPFAARKLNIPDVGYCAGLKLIAPLDLTRNYQTMQQKLANKLNQFILEKKLSASFHYLELLSSTNQMVFAPKALIDEEFWIKPKGTVLVGALPNYDFEIDNNMSLPENAIILCFGSALDPANYPEITTLIMHIAKQFKRHLIIGSKLLNIHSSDITTSAYLPLPQLMRTTELIIHHGGYNTFTEALAGGTPQILIPLTNDQPIQAKFLEQLNAGVVIHPESLTATSVKRAFKKLLNKNNPIHQHIKIVKKYYEKADGAENAADLVGQLTNSKLG